jgi:hypothetical protein
MMRPRCACPKLPATADTDAAHRLRLDPFRFLGDSIAQLEPLRASDGMRRIDALAVHQRHTMETGGPKAAK